MRIARRIRAIRLEHSRSIETVEARAGFAKGLIARLESGEEVPSMKILEKLAEVFSVPLHQFLFADPESISTPWLTPRLSLEDLATLDAFPAAGSRPN